MFSSMYKLLIIISVFTLFSQSVSAMEQCADIFPDATTEYGTQLAVPTFLNSNDSGGNQSGSNLNLDEGDYSNITLASSGNLSFTTTNGLYKADVVEVGERATISFVAGDYYFSSMNLMEDSVLTIEGSGTVRIFVENDLILEPEVLINDDRDPLLMVISGDVDALLATEVRFSGLMYVVGDITVGNRIDIHGAVTGLNVNLTSPEILDYVDDFLTEIDFDGTCISTLIDFQDALLAYYPFEQSDFTTNILDESGNGNNGTNMGGAVTTAGQYCRGFDSNGSNTTSVTDNAFSTNIDLDDDVGQTGTISFWYQANNDWNDVDRTLFNATMINGSNTDGENKYFYLQTEGNLLSFDFENEDDDDFSIEEVIPDDIGNSGVWHYISVTWNILDDVFQIYIDGNLLVQRSEDDDGSDFDTDRSFGELGDIVFGDNATNYINGGRFTSADGNFDEVRIYNQVLSQSEIEADMNDNNCIDHYQIHHELTGLTCAPESLTIKACTNTFDSNNIICNEVEEAVSLDINVNNSAIFSGLNFSSSAIVNFNNTTAETVTFSISNTTTSPLNGLRCVVNNTTNESANCQMTFADTGFIFSTDNSSGIDHQLSGKASNVGFNAGTISIQAVENDGTGACAAVLINQPIELAAECTDNSSCGSSLSINSTDIATSTNSSGSPSNYTNIDLGFDTNAAAAFILNYPDAGSMTLHARYNIPSTDGTLSGDFIIGDASFTVRPLGFDVEVVTTDSNRINPSAINANGSAFIGAGQDFDVAISAKQWEAADDTNNDGIPDDNAVLSNNTTTANFTENVTIAHQLLSPLSGQNPDLSESTFTSSLFSNGVATLTTSWTEVGILRFDTHIDDNDYLGAGDVQGSVPFVGRFIPDHYQQTVDDNGVLSAAGNDWVYTGETDDGGLTGAIEYGTQPLLRITAYAANDDVTQNYTIGGDFIMLSASDITIAEPENDNTELGVDNTNLVRLIADINEGSLVAHSSVNGALTYTMDDRDHFVYRKEANSEIAPFSAQIPLTVTQITDSDGVTQGTDAFDLVTAIPTGIEVRFGRLFIANSYGPETEPLTIPMQLHVFDGNDYVVNNDDNFTVISTEGDELTLITGTATVNSITSNSIDGYVYFVELTSVNDARGQVDFEYSVDTWLQDDSDNDNLFDENPTASAEFGVYRGNDRIILWREINP